MKAQVEQNGYCMRMGSGTAGDVYKTQFTMQVFKATYVVLGLVQGVTGSSTPANLNRKKW